MKNGHCELNSIFIGFHYAIACILQFKSICSTVRSYCSSPAGTVPVTSSPKEDHPQEGHDEAEDGDKHHPGQRVMERHMI